MSYCYFVIADEDTVLGFRAAGVPGAPVEGRQEALEALDAAKRRNVGLILVSEEVASMIREEVDALRLRGTAPMVVETPGPEGPMPGRRSLSDLIREAIGVKL